MPKSNVVGALMQYGLAERRMIAGAAVTKVLGDDPSANSLGDNLSANSLGDDLSADSLVGVAPSKSEQLLARARHALV